MSIAIKKGLGIKGCAVWKLDENGREGEKPCVDNVSVTLPAIELETTSINLMGSLDVPDVSRIGNMQLSCTVPLDIKEAMDLCDLGKTVSWLITWCSQEYNSTTGETVAKSYSVRATGFITSIPNAEVNAGAENTGEITMNLIKYKKECISDNYVAFEIDRGAGIFKIRGNNIYEQFSKLY